MIPAFLKRIPIIIKNTFNPEFEGTVIQHYCKPSSLPIKGISSINQVSVINVQGSGMVGKAGFSGRLFSLLSREQINVILITQSSSEHSITFAVRPADAQPRGCAERQRLDDLGVDNVEYGRINTNS